MYQIVFLLISSLLFISCNETTKEKAKKLELPYYNEPDFTPLFVKDKVELEKLVSHKIANFAFLNQDSSVITQAIFENKIHIANFIFTSCGSICPVMTTNMKIVNDSIGSQNDIIFLSYSVTPWIDKPSVLKDYMLKNEISNTNWQFLTGSKAAIYHLARQSYFAEEDFGFSKDSTVFLHTEHFILVDKNKRIRGIYNGTLVTEMHNLIEDVAMLREGK